MEIKAHILALSLVLAAVTVCSTAVAQDGKAKLGCKWKADAEVGTCELLGADALPKTAKIAVKFNNAALPEGCEQEGLTVKIVAGNTEDELKETVECVEAKRLDDGVSASCEHKSAKKLRFEVSCTKAGNTKVWKAKFDVQSGDVATETDDGDPPATTFPIAVWRQILEEELGRSISGVQFGHYYEDNVAVLFYNTGAVPYFPLPEVDENDSIWVVVVDRKEVGTVEIALNGCNRPPLFPRVFRPSSGEATSEQKQNREEPRWQFTLRAFGKCAGADSGGPQLTVTNGSKTAMATVTVNPLYRFNVGVALGYDFTNERSFAVRTPAGDTVPRVAQSSEGLGLTSLIYVAFHILPRDFRKEAFFGDQTLSRLQLFVGVDPRAIDEHLVVGAGYEVAVGFNVLAGWRVATKQDILAEGSQLEPGSAFDQDSSVLPTRKRWETGLPFLGISMNSELLSRLK